MTHRFFALLAPLLLVAAACTSASDEIASAQSNTRGESVATPDGELVWGGCSNDLASVAGLECARLAVPIDQQAEDSNTIDLTLARVPSSGNPDERIGSLLFNPGGPGGSGIDFLAAAALMMPEELQERFDLVSWDPRGVGESTPVRCITDKQKDAQTKGDLSPDDKAEMDRAIADQEEFLEGCESNNPELIEHMSTADVAGDMDEIREALGDEKLNYVGFSYGTAIGATYATMFPDRLRAMVLDGSVSPTATDLEQTTTQAQGFERTYLNFVATCDEDPECALSGRTARTVDEVRSSLDEDPVIVDTASGARELTRDLFDIGLATGLYDTSIWGPLARAIDDIDGDGGGLILSLADRQLGRNNDGTWDNSSDAQTMVNCADAQDRPTINEAIAAVDEVAAAAPTFGEVLKTGPLSCLNWPIPANPVPDWTAAGAPPILVVGTLGDPATPYEWSEQMTQALGGSVLLTYEGDGHTAFMRGGPCVDDAVVAYLVDLELPGPGTSCPANTSSAGTGVGDLREQLIEELAAAGLPESVAKCIADRLEEDLGTTGLEDLLLSGDPEELTQKVTDITLECMAGG
jgi:pimeloyl-ACP methyl ester carboxylesterase